MKNTILFKSLIDFLYIFLFLGIIGTGLLIPLGIVNLNDAKHSIENLETIHWSLIMLSFLTYIIFLRGLYFLRKVARFLLSNKFFTDKIISNLRKSGIHFIASGLIHFLLIIGLTVSKLFAGKLELGIDSNGLATLFIIIIGMFLTLQSNILKLGKDLKEENDLTV